MGQLHQTDFLMPSSSFLQGMGSVMDLEAAHFFHYNVSDTPQEADDLALRADWAMVAHDLRTAMAQFHQHSSVPQ